MIDKEPLYCLLSAFVLMTIGFIVAMVFLEKQQDQLERHQAFHECVDLSRKDHRLVAFHLAICEEQFSGPAKLR